MQNKLFLKFFNFSILKRLYNERLGEPFIYLLISFFVFLFGNLRQKIKYDLVPREAYAYGILAAADLAKINNVKKIILIEFGVAAGGGLLNMCYIAKEVTKLTGIEFQIFGFDTGKGMPEPLNYKDHPEKYFTGDYPLVDRAALLKKLPTNATIIFGKIEDSVNDFLKNVKFPIGFVSIDVDYYYSTVDCLKVFNSFPELYLPYVFTYFDDVYNIDHNIFCGELLAIKEFNDVNTLRKISIATMLNNSRIFRRSPWTHQTYLTHIFDHESRSIQYIEAHNVGITILANPYLS
jgi:hypothetical protein